MTRKIFARYAALVAACVCGAFGPCAWAQAAMLGDVNADGAMNVLDVQNMIGQALTNPLEGPVEADLDEDGEINIVDVQNMINTVLGEGGLVQQVAGDVNCSGDCTHLRIRAVSQDGSCEYADVDPETGEFLLRLRVNTAWALALCHVEEEESQVQETFLAQFQFSIEGVTSSTLPVLGLSQCERLQLGQLVREENRIRVQNAIRAMLRQRARHIDEGDENENGLPDFVEPLLNRLRSGAPGLPPHEMGMGPLYTLVAPCVTAWLEEGFTPDLTDANEDGVPDFVEPLLACVQEAIPAWLANQGVEVPPADTDQNGVPDFVDALMLHVREGIRAWLGELGRPDLVDEDEDGIPDFVEDHLAEIGVPCPFDEDGDGIPDFAGDEDGDGIPNCLDEDAQCDGDADCDGVDDDDDVDDDNDGTPDYAE